MALCRPINPKWHPACPILRLPSGIISAVRLTSHHGRCLNWQAVGYEPSSNSCTGLQPCLSGICNAPPSRQHENETTQVMCPPV